MNVPHHLIWEHGLYTFKLVHETAEVTKNLCYMKGEGTIDFKIVSRWMKKFWSGCKNLKELAKSKTMDSEVLLQALEADPVSIRRVWHFTIQFGWSPSQLRQKYPELPDCLISTKYCKTFDSPKY